MKNDSARLGRAVAPYLQRVKQSTRALPNGIREICLAVKSLVGSAFLSNAFDCRILRVLQPLYLQQGSFDASGRNTTTYEFIPLVGSDAIHPTQ